MELKSIVKHVYNLNKNLYRIVRSNNKYRHLLHFKKKMLTFRDIHTDERCFILGNGPSLKDLDFSLLSNEYVFTVNKLALYTEYYKLRANYHVWTDPIFFDMNLGEESSLLKAFRNIRTDGNCPITFMPFRGYQFADKNNLSSVLDLIFFDNCLQFHDYLPRKIQLEKYFYNFSTVVMTAISIAIYMGFKEIYLLGCDCTGILNSINIQLEQSKMEYAYDVDQESRKMMKKNLEERSMEVELYGQYSLFHQYKFFSNYCKKRNILLMNCSTTTLLDAVPRIDILSVLSKTN